MNFAPVALQRGWCFDSNTKLSLASARSLLQAPYPGTPKRAPIRYVSLGAPSPYDITIAERDDIFAAGWPSMGLVQHVNNPSWKADASLGTAHGAAAAAHAQLVSYPPGCHLGLDIEGLGDAGAPVYDYICYWHDAVASAGYLTLPYDGYADGIADTWKILLVSRGIIRPGDWWSDFGPRALPAGQTFAMKQHVQTTLGGVCVDPDEVLVGGVIMFMGREQDATSGDVADGSHT